MILPDVILSEHPRALVPLRTVEPPPPEREEAVVEEVLEVALEEERPASVPVVSAERDPVEEVASAGDIASAVPVIDPPVPVREPELTFDKVAAWLAEQEGETRQSCASLLADDLAQIYNAAREEGFAAGRADARKAADAQYGDILNQLQEVVYASEVAFDREAHSLSELCVDIVAEAFRKIAGTFFPTPEAVSAVVCEVLARVKEGRELSVRVNPTDLVTLQECGQAEKLAAVLGGRQFTLAADTRVELGGCIVESKLGSLDGRLEVQLRELYETLRLAKSAQPEQA